jgi:hypothetical protein
MENDRASISDVKTLLAQNGRAALASDVALGV